MIPGWKWTSQSIQSPPHCWLEILSPKGTAASTAEDSRGRICCEFCKGWHNAHCFQDRGPRSGIVQLMSAYCCSGSSKPIKASQHQCVRGKNHGLPQSRSDWLENQHLQPWWITKGPVDRGVQKFLKECPLSEQMRQHWSIRLKKVRGKQLFLSLFWLNYA